MIICKLMIVVKFRLFCHAKYKLLEVIKTGLPSKDNNCSRGQDRISFHTTTLN